MMSLWINGEWLAGSGAARQSANPVTGEATWAGNDASPLQV
ncbi:N-succinylglutamate 5-semialdehyde dehydrogenase [Kluyvera cryocrescens]|uniref:N-succinylglutamate 5-semialdehyde dehydrogenase n=1 Tax=Kluyvera cryocrescens TaxID=580 RepID=A0A485AB45_KLUCR|nr:N-succinylglutamate 5-semialdehyde dehydrogenase [Kluyvera cryocrescens]